MSNTHLTFAYFFFVLFLILSTFSFFFFFNDTATTEIYTLSLHDALPISSRPHSGWPRATASKWTTRRRSEEHTSELQSRLHLVCRLLLEKKKKKKKIKIIKNKHYNNDKIATYQQQHD